MRWVSFDQGNSTLKWCVWETGEGERAVIRNRGSCTEGASVSGLGGLAEHIAGATIESALYCGVTGEESASLVRATWETISGGAPWQEPRETMVIECEDPEQVGRDRLLAAQAAFEVQGEGVVVDAGTALTVDAVGPGPTFLGGAIAPGPSALAEALGRAGAKLFKIDPDPDAGALGRSTSRALEAGVSVGFAGAAERLVEEVAREANLAGAPVILTGGARSFLSREGLFGDRTVRVFADLVHLGLLVAAGVPADLQEERWLSSSGN